MKATQQQIFEATQRERAYQDAKPHIANPDDGTGRLASAVCVNISLALLNAERDADPQARLRACAKGLLGMYKADWVGARGIPEFEDKDWV